MNNELRAQNFRLFLQDKLLERCRKNPGYSLRAFAKHLDTDFSALAKMMKGQRPIGNRMIEKFGLRLGLSALEVQQFLDARKQHRRKAKRALLSGTRPAAGAEAAPDYQQVAVDSFKIISDWYHYGILELLRLDHFEADPIWISKTLGITINEARIAIERLQRVGILEITDEGKWIDHSGGRSTTLGADYTTAAFRNLQKQVLEKAIEALIDYGMEERDQSSMTMAIDSRLLPEAKERLKTFRRELAAFLSRGERHDRVYHMSLSLYPVSKKVQQTKSELKKCTENKEKENEVQY